MADQALMPLELTRFLADNASAIFGLVGAFGGALLSFLATLFLKKRDFDLQMWSKLLDRRIAAHENVISLAIELRVMVALGGTNEAGEVRRAPQALLSKEEFERWFARFAQLTGEGTTWLTVSAKREVNLVQDYLVTLHMHLSDVPSDRYPLVGEHIRQDFIDLSSSLEKVAFAFFEGEVRKLRLDSLDKHHKYKTTETDDRLRGTALLKNWDEIAAKVK